MTKMTLNINRAVSSSLTVARHYHSKTFNPKCSKHSAVTHRDSCSKHACIYVLWSMLCQTHALQLLYLTCIIAKFILVVVYPVSSILTSDVVCLSVGTFSFRALWTITKSVSHFKEYCSSSWAKRLGRYSFLRCL